jgi:hypothetical protein
MKKIATLLFMLGYLSACKNNNAENLAPQVSICLVQKITYTNHPSIKELSFEYTKDRKLVKVSRLSSTNVATFDSLIYGASGSVEKLISYNTSRKATLTLSLKYDANQLMEVVRENTAIKEKPTYALNKNINRWETKTTYDQYSWEAATQNYDYDAKGNSIKIMTVQTGEIPGFGKINHQFSRYEMTQKDEKNHFSQGSAELGLYFFLRGDHPYLVCKNNPLTLRVSDKVTVSFLGDKSIADVSYQIQKRAYLYNDKGFATEETLDVYDEKDLKLIRRSMATITYNCL